MKWKIGKKKRKMKHYQNKEEEKKNSSNERTSCITRFPYFILHATYCHRQLDHNAD
jgi:hypothetical protein